MDESPTSGPEIRRRASAHVLVDVADLAVDQLVVDDATDHHLGRVLRLRDGDAVTATDGAGRWRAYRAVAGVRGGALRYEATDDVHVDVRPARSVTVASAMPKGDRLDWLVQKTTECGVDRLVLLDCERSVVRWKPERAERQLARLQRVADDALRQSRRVWRPEIHGPTPAAELLPTAAVAEPGGGRLTSDHTTVAIGPEGGWSAAELGMITVSVELAPHVLRTETAAIVATALCVALRH